MSEERRRELNKLIRKLERLIEQALAQSPVMEQKAQWLSSMKQRDKRPSSSPAPSENAVLPPDASSAPEKAQTGWVSSSFEELIALGLDTNPVLVISPMPAASPRQPGTSSDYEESHVESLKMAGKPVRRENWIRLAWGREAPVPWTAEHEAELPSELQDWDKIDRE